MTPAAHIGLRVVLDHIERAGGLIAHAFSEQASEVADYTRQPARRLPFSLAHNSNPIGGSKETGRSGVPQAAHTNNAPAPLSQNGRGGADHLSDSSLGCDPHRNFSFNQHDGSYGRESA